MSAEGVTDEENVDVLYGSRRSALSHMAAGKQVILGSGGPLTCPGADLRRRAGTGEEKLPGVRVLAVAAAAVLVGGTALFGAGSAAAEPAPLTLQYTCSFPLIGDQPMTASIVWDASDTHMVGRPTPLLPVNASATLGPIVSEALGLIGARTVEGTAEVSAAVAAPQGDIDATVPLDVPVTGIPGSGSMTVAARGTVPSFTFSEPGSAVITVGGLTLHFTPRTAGGGQTVLGEVSTSCELDAGQNNVLTSFQIIPAPGRSRTPGGPAAGRVGPRASRSARATVGPSSAGPGPEASGTTSGTALVKAADAPSVTSAADRSTGGVDLTESVLAAAGVLALIAAAVGCVAWLRHRRPGTDGPEG